MRRTPTLAPPTPHPRPPPPATPTLTHQPPPLAPNPHLAHHPHAHPSTEQQVRPQLYGAPHLLRALSTQLLARYLRKCFGGGRAMQ